MGDYFNINGKNVDMELARKLYSDGEFDRNDRKTLGNLTKTEAAELVRQLSGPSKDDLVEGLMREPEELNEVVVTGKKPSKFGKWVKDHKGLAIAGSVIIAGVIVSIAFPHVGAFVAGVAKAAFSAKGLGVLAGLGAVSLGVASCSKEERTEPPVREGNKTYVYNTINIKIQIENDNEDIKQLLKQIVDLQNSINNRLKEGFDDLMNSTYNMFNTVMTALGNLQNGQEEQLKVLLKILEKINECVNNQENMEQSMVNNFNTVITLLNNLGDKGTVILDKIVDLITEGNANTGAILALLQNLKPGDSKDEEILAVLEKILVQVTQNGKENDENFATVIELLTNIKNGQETSNEWFEKLFLELVNQHKDINEIKALLEAFDVDMATVIELLKESNENEVAILEAISNGDKKVNELLNQILAEVKKGNEIGNNNGKILNQILAALQGLEPGKDDNIIALLEKILGQVTANVQATKDMDANTQNNFTMVIELLGKLGASGDAILEAIINNGKMEADQFEALKALIIKNNELTAKTNEWMAKLDANQKAILEKLKEFKPSGTPADLTEITNLLKNINDNVIKNGDTQTQILEKIEVLSLAVNQLVDVVGDNNKAILLQILNKIPEACKCKPVDISEVIKILIEIREKIEGGNHEGILEDLDEYFS